MVRGKVYAVDGSGLGDELRLVALVCVSHSPDHRGVATLKCSHLILISKCLHLNTFLDLLIFRMYTQYMST